ncbi:MAG: YitT family protein [Clostridia bacterium]|nr:YitT family protein [Clostridia bacterium]
MVKKIIKDYAVITFAAVVAAAAIYFFMLPSHVAIGSGSALAMVLSNFIPLPVSVISLSLNIIFLILGFILIGPEFGAKTVYTTILVPISLGIFETFFPDFKSLTDDPMLDMVCYLLIVGMAMALLFSHNASSGGLDIVAKIMHKYLKMELGTAISISGLTVALTTVFAYDSKTVVLSILGTYLSGIVVDKFIFGLNIKRRVCILSKEHMQEILDYILHDLHSGASLYDVIGAYDGVTRREILTIVDNNEYRKLMDFVKKTDPTAFVTVYSVNELRYQPKK